MGCGPNEKEEGNDVVEAHCYFVNIGLTDREQICSRRIKMITGCFGHVELCQLCTKLFCMQLTKAYVAETSCKHCY